MIYTMATTRPVWLAENRTENWHGKKLLQKIYRRNLILHLTRTQIYHVTVPSYWRYHLQSIQMPNEFYTSLKGNQLPRKLCSSTFSRSYTWSTGYAKKNYYIVIHSIKMRQVIIITEVNSSLYVVCNYFVLVTVF